MRTESQISAERAYKERKRLERKAACEAAGVPFKTHKWRKRFIGESDIQFRRRYNKEFHAKNKERRNKYNTELRNSLKDQYLEKERAYRAANRERILEANKKWARENKSKLKKLNAAYAKRNRAARTKQQCNYIRERRKRDPEYRLLFRLRSRVWDAIQPQSAKKAARTLELLGCDSAFFKMHLESQFKPDMSWENYGEYWQIDHRVPVSYFDLTKPEEQRRAFHYINCQPLESEENNLKADTLPENYLEILSSIDSCLASVIEYK